MTITIELTPEDEAALNYAAEKAGTPARPGVPEVVIAPEDYLRARVADLLASYAEQMSAEESGLIIAAFKQAPEADRAAAFAALKVDRSPVTATK